MRTKFLLILSFCLGLVAQSKAADTDTYQNYLYLSSQTAQAGTKQYMLSLKMKNVDDVSGFQIEIYLPEGLSFSADEDGMSLASMNADRVPAGKFVMNSRIKEDGSLGITFFTASANPSTGHLFTVSGNDGEVIAVPIDIPADFAPGDYTITLRKEELAGPNAELAGKFNERTSTLTITAPENRTVLDETSTTEPKASDGAVDVRVNRTIYANTWSTICLPFDMSGEQLKSAFGDDVRLAEFTDWSAEVADEDNDDYAQSLTINFSTVTSLKANTPYIIKTNQDITTFTVDGVTIAPGEVLTRMGNRRQGTLARFYGTYKAQTRLDNGMLFLNDNKFWYSTGNTLSKAYRCYLELYWMLDYNSDSPSKIDFFVDQNETTGINGLVVKPMANGKVYTLGGVCVGKADNISQLPKGIYVLNGQKFLKQE